MQPSSQEQREEAIKRRKETTWRSGKILPSDNSIVLIDGSVEGEIYERSDADLKHLWVNAAFFRNGPQIAKQVHQEFFEIGCQVATVNSYMASRTRLEGCKIEEPPSKICSMAVEMAQEARKQNGSGVLAGSLGPLFNSYRPDQDSKMSFNEQVELYVEYMDNLMDSDILLFETVSSLFQADTIVEAIRKRQPSKPVWVSVTVDDLDGKKLRSGEPVQSLRAVADTGLFEALFVNCSKAQVIGDALEVIKTFGIPFGGYANGAEEVEKFVQTKDFDQFQEREDLNPEKYADFVIDWIKRGATVVGGCCRITPKYMVEVKNRIEKEGFKIHCFK